MGILGDALGMAGSAISAPGDYTRGLLAGRPGERMGGRDLLRHYGLAGEEDNWGNFLGGMATDVLTDPLTYATMGMGAGGGGAAAGSLFGKIGPRYGSSAAKLAELAIPAAEQARGGAALIPEVLGSGAAKSVLHEIPSGSKYLGAGAEALNLQTPAGDVLKIARHNPAAAVAVPDLEGVIQPSRRVVHGGWEVNRVPMAQNVGDKAVADEFMANTRPHLQQYGVDLYDLKPEDIGLVGGKPTLLDMGSYDLTGQVVPPFRQIRGPTPASWRAAGRGAGAAAGVGTNALLQALLGGGGSQ